MNIHPLPSRLGFCMVVPGFLSAAECDGFIARGEAAGFASAGTDYPPSYRNNERVVVDDPALADGMTTRLRLHLPQAHTNAGDGDDAQWTLQGVNERFRFCRYRASQAFHIHQDGVHHRSDTLRSQLTFMIYLTDGDEFEGGDTLFFEGGPGTAAAGEPHPPVVARVRPRAGSLIVFDHKIWHAGDVVTRGVKHIMRSDVLYRREAADGSATRHPFEPAHAGYVWTLCELGTDMVASGGRDTAIRLWTKDGRPAGLLQGHDQSVLGLARLDGRRIASVSRDRTLRIWDLSSQACERVSTPHRGAILCVAHWKGLIVTGSADGAIRLSDTTTGKETALADGLGWVWAVAVSSDGMLVAALEDGMLRCWDLAGMRAIERLDGTIPLRTLALSDDGRWLAAGDTAGNVRVWMRDRDAGRWTLAASWRAHGAAVRRVRFAGDGRLASGGEDGLAKMWVLPGQTPSWHAEHRNFVTDVLPLADGSVLTCAYDGRIARHEP